MQYKCRYNVRYVNVENDMEKTCFRHFTTFHKTFTIYVAWSMPYISAINEISNEPSNLIKTTKWQTNDMALFLNFDCSYFSAKLHNV